MRHDTRAVSLSRPRGAGVRLGVHIEVRIVGSTPAQGAMDDQEIQYRKARSEDGDSDGGWCNHILVPEAGVDHPPQSIGSPMATAGIKISCCGRAGFTLLARPLTIFALA